MNTNRDKVIFWRLVALVVLALLPVGVAASLWPPAQPIAAAPGSNGIMYVYLYPEGRGDLYNNPSCGSAGRCEVFSVHWQLKVHDTGNQYSGTVGYDGNRTLTLKIPTQSCSPCSVSVWVHPDGYLAKKRTLYACGGLGTCQMHMPGFSTYIKGGDFNQDNTVDIVDYNNEWYGHFGCEYGKDECYRDDLDIARTDGARVINIDDWNIFYNNFGLSGDATIW